MRRTFFLLLLLTAGCRLLSVVNAQSTAIIGTGTSYNDPYTYPAPYGNYFYGAKHQILIRASELTAAGMQAGNISAIAFNVFTAMGTPLNGFSIRMKTTTATAVGTTFDNAGFTNVFGPQPYTETTGWSNHTFSTPFAWNGTSNLLIQVCFNNNNYSANAQMRYTPTAYNSVAYFSQDMMGICTEPSGITSMNRPNIRFTYTTNGPPTAQFTAAPTASCSGNISFTDQSFYGITAWLWNFGDGGTSTVQHPTHTYTASGTYSVSLKVTNANGNNTLVKPNYITVSFNGTALPAACTPSTTAYCCGFGITNFSFNKINNNSSDAAEGYGDFTCMKDTVTPGQAYNISVATPTPATHNVRVWLDLNNDGNFNPTGELVFSKDNSSTATGSVFIPGTAVTGAFVRMRVSAEHSLEPIPTPCSNLKYGQAEDYAIYIKPNTSPPVAKFTADDTVSCSGNIQFTDQSLNVPASWQWNFGDGKTSTQQNPAHTYTASGTYSVSLSATNANGTNALVKNAYIKVTLGNIPKAPGCQPATLSYCCGYGIYKVLAGTINKSSKDASEGYRDFSCTDQATFTEGQTYNINIQTHPSLVQDTKLWIDLNNDGTFNQANELLFSKANTVNPGGTITIPTSGAVYGVLLRMRILSDNGGSNPNSCTVVKGQAEDYGVIIQKMVGVEEAEAEAKAEVKVYPNPFSEAATVEVSGLPPSSDLEFRVYDIYGRAVLSISRQSSVFSLQRGNLSPGIYVYEVCSGREVIGKGKVVVE